MDQNQIPAGNTLQVLPEGIIELKQTGYQTKESITQYQAQIDDLTTQMHTNGQKALILVDVSGVTGQAPEVLAAARERLDGNYDALALFGTSPTVKVLLGWMLNTFGKKEKIQLFSSREEAISWLQSRR